MIDIKIKDRPKFQCWIDPEGNTYYLSEQKVKEYGDDLVSVHAAILREYFPTYPSDYFSRMGWIPYGSLITGNRNRDDVEPTQAQINRIYDLDLKLTNYLRENEKYGNFIQSLEDLNEIQKKYFDELKIVEKEYEKFFGHNPHDEANWSWIDATYGVFEFNFKNIKKEADEINQREENVNSTNYRLCDWLYYFSNYFLPLCV